MTEFDCRNQVSQIQNFKSAIKEIGIQYGLMMIDYTFT